MADSFSWGLCRLLSCLALNVLIPMMSKFNRDVLHSQFCKLRAVEQRVDYIHQGHCNTWFWAVVILCERYVLDRHAPALPMLKVSPAHGILSSATEENWSFVRLSRLIPVGVFLVSFEQIGQIEEWRNSDFTEPELPRCWAVWPCPGSGHAR